jgi:hypothetical protein
VEHSTCIIELSADAVEGEGRTRAQAIVRDLRKAGMRVEGDGMVLRPWKVTYEDVKRIQALDLVMKALDDADEDWDFYIAVG